MRALHKLKIGVRLGLGFGLLVLMLSAMAAFSLLRLEGILSTVKYGDKILTEKLQPLYVAREALDQTGLAARNAFIFTDNADAMKERAFHHEQKEISLAALKSLARACKDDHDCRNVSARW